MDTEATCLKCGAPLTPDARDGVCPRCLLGQALAGSATGGTGGAAAAAPPLPDAVRTLPVPGQTFGGYYIHRLLGRGGMGEVYEAEHLATGRRVALKVMGQTLASEQDRTRFLREGRLAASVNHPNVVYIYGSEEIAGAPVITMELLGGGTLRDRLKRQGPLPVADAVAAMLQVIAGLEAVHAAGVLHRDIKPGNCVVAADGTVKIGDFGLSIATAGRIETLVTGISTQLGTPAYASPEQLRGEALDVRSDIYSVGATLYHLLTGQPPFPGTDLVQLISQVLDKVPQAPRALRREIPTELSRLILRCLAKDRKARFQTYAELRQALLPFQPGEPVPANPARRGLAGLIDEMLTVTPRLAFAMYWGFSPLVHLQQERTFGAVLLWLPFCLFRLLYYGLSEGLWGASPGKALCGLRVVGPDRLAPRPKRALLRAVVHWAPLVMPPLLLMPFLTPDQLRDLKGQTGEWMIQSVQLLLFGLLFVTMRTRNGYAAAQDSVSQTRVIVRRQTQVRPTLVTEAPTGLHPEWPQPASTLETARGLVSVPAMIGPYETRQSLWRCGEEELLLAFDTVLRRKVWVHLRPAGAEPVSGLRRDLSRPARLHWLNGGRETTRQWDAYEAVEGKALLRLVERPQPWNRVRFWLFDLAEELSAALAAPGSASIPGLDRVWISASGRAFLLEFRAPGIPVDMTSATATPLDLAGLHHFLKAVADTALGGRVELVPAPSAQDERPLAALPVALPDQQAPQWLGTGGKGGFVAVSPSAMRARITTGRRIVSLTLFPALCVGLALFLAFVEGQNQFQFDHWWAQQYTARPSLRGAVSLSYIGRGLRETGDSTDANVLSGYILHYFGDLITNETFWNEPAVTKAFPAEIRVELQRTVMDRPAPPPHELQAAERLIGEIVPSAAHLKYAGVELVSEFGDCLSSSLAVFWAGLAVIEFLGILLFSRNLSLRLFGIALVGRNGMHAGRLRLLRRWVAVWFPVLGLLRVLQQAFCASPSPTVFGTIAGVGGGLTLAGALAYAIRHPNRSLADCLAGTRLARPWACADNDPAPPTVNALQKVRLPLHARLFLDALATGDHNHPAVLVANLHLLLAKTPAVTQLRRLASLALGLAFVVLGALVITHQVVFCTLAHRLDCWFANRYPQRPSFIEIVRLHADHGPSLAVGQTPSGPSGPTPLTFGYGPRRGGLLPPGDHPVPEAPSRWKQRTTAETVAVHVCLLGHFSELITNESSWADPMVRLKFPGDVLRRQLRAEVTGHPPPRPQDLQAAERIVLPMVQAMQCEKRWIQLYVLTWGFGCSLFGLALVEMLGTLVVGQSVLLRLSGVAVVDRNGQPATRRWLVGRWLAGWFAVFMLSLLLSRCVCSVFVEFESGPHRLLRFDEAGLSVWMTLASVGVALAGGFWYGVRHPERGLSDLLAGTWLVSR